MTRSAAPAADRFTLRRRGAAGGPWLDLATWPTSELAAAYCGFFAAVHSCERGGELVLFDGGGAVACSLRVTFALTVSITGDGALFGVER